MVNLSAKRWTKL